MHAPNANHNLPELGTMNHAQNILPKSYPDADALVNKARIQCGAFLCTRAPNKIDKGTQNRKLHQWLNNPTQSSEQ
jgi:hypothetical protein